MKKYILRIVLFLFIGYLIGEIVVRVFHMTVDVPETYVDENHLVRFYPNQTGYSSDRFKWIINKYGNFGYEPQSLDSLVTVIGNSFISGTMNPPECHQANYLASMNHDYNFYPMSRDGASFLEFMEMARSMEHLNPCKQLLYVHPSDFIVSVTERVNQTGTVQLSLESGVVRDTQPGSNSLKRKLYKFKFAYFLYRNYIVPYLVDLNMAGGRADESLFEIRESDYPYIQELLDYVKDHYVLDNIVLVFFPDSDPGLIRMTEQAGFTALLLQTDDYRSWVTNIGGHWNCNGHKEVAKQVDNYLASLSR